MAGMTGPKTRACPVCGTRFELAATGRPRQYCSRACARKARQAEEAGELADQAQLLAGRIAGLPARDRQLVLALLDWLDR